jgi:hypothetical protein
VLLDINASPALPVCQSTKDRPEALPWVDSGSLELERRELERRKEAVLAEEAEFEQRAGTREEVKVSA